MEMCLDTSLLQKSDCCATRYPILLVHGIMQRDGASEWNWGRIPATLRSRGATVDFGKQDGVGSCSGNAEQLRWRIDAWLAETGAEKVNVVAHSKGGLDIRYLLAQRGSASKIASVTTISTPHQGLNVLDAVIKLPYPIKVVGASAVNLFFRVLGDESPNLQEAFREMTPAACAMLNGSADNDATDMLCQSFTARLPGVRNDPAAVFTYGLLTHFDGDNDGVVSIASAKWGNHRGTLTSEGRRGVSHFDLRDFYRRDFFDLDIPLFYATIVAELKAQGL
jgi:triacylglycerol lipase